MKVVVLGSGVIGTSIAYYLAKDGHQVEVIDRQAGLPCRCCGTATDLLAVEVWGCPCCHLQLPRARRDGLEAADPQHCPWCNP